MKKKISLVLMVLFLFAILLPITASAHKGKTDAYGGHYDSSTGEYHYHHGFEAHQHYDINGDGIPDCPYDYEDRTNHTSGTSSSTSRTVGISEETKPPEFFTIVKEVEVPVSHIPDWVFYIFTGCAIAILILFIISQKRKYKIEEQKESMEQQLESMKYATRDSLQTLLSDLEEEYGCGFMYAICRDPPDDYLGDDDLPASKEKDGHKWGEKYTFYFSGYNKSMKYHKLSCRHANKIFPVNALTISKGKNKFSPCAVCSPTLPDLQWAERFLKYKSFFAKFGITIKQDVPKIDISKNPDFGNITLEYVECRALEYGLPMETVLKIINQRRMKVGMRQIELDELYELE